MYFLSIFRAFLAVRPGTGLCGVPPSPLFLSLTLFVYNLWMEEKRDRKRRERERERERERGGRRALPSPHPFFSSSGPLRLLPIRTNKIRGGEEHTHSDSLHTYYHSA